jgi:hypothetical protein
MSERGTSTKPGRDMPDTYRGQRPPPPPPKDTGTTTQTGTQGGTDKPATTTQTDKKK